MSQRSQPPFPDGPPVPLLTEGILDAATLRQLVTDLQAATVVQSVREKGPPGRYAAPDDLPLDTAFDRLLTGLARSLQIRYQYDGHDWVDTILALPSGFRVVRCRYDT